jgi:hypothetical protein
MCLEFLLKQFRNTFVFHSVGLGVPERGKSTAHKRQTRGFADEKQVKYLK